MCATPFELVHIDTWSPFSVPTVEGYKYFLTIVDDFSRATWVYLLHQKPDILEVFPNFLKMVETQYVKKIKSVRSDNAHELFLSKDIIAYHSCPKTPQQNFVVERKYQHLLNVSRALLFQYNIPLEYWGIAY